MDKYADLQIDDIAFCADSEGSGYIKIYWSSGAGWGECKLGIYTEDDKKEFYVDSECMGKEFCMALLEKLYDKCEGDK